jgi:hypothetical protein
MGLGWGQSEWKGMMDIYLSIKYALYILYIIKYYIHICSRNC